MDLLVFDGKRNRYSAETQVCLNKEDLQQVLGNRRINAFLAGGLVQIFDEAASRIINECSGIGRWLEDERKESRGISRTCFSQKENVCSGSTTEKTENFDNLVHNETMRWTELNPAISSLILSPMEVVFLSIDWQVINIKMERITLTNEEVWNKMKSYSDEPDQFGKNYAVFRFLRNNGWIVRSGITFGCDFLIYCLGIQFYHSSAGVIIADSVDPRRLLTLTRILAHNKKCLIVATTTEDVQTFEDVFSVEVKIVTMKTYFLERDVSQMSNKVNETYNLKCFD